MRKSWTLCASFVAKKEVAEVYILEGRGSISEATYCPPEGLDTEHASVTDPEDHISFQASR